MHSEKTTIRLAAVDMDGTLLHDDKSISDYTLDVLRRIVKKGVILVPASGRPIGGMKEAVLNNVDGIQYAICSNGAMLMDVPEEKSICETGIPTEKAVEAIAYLEQFPVAVYAHTDKGTFRAEGWEKTGLSEKYPYIRFSEGNVKDLGAFLRTSGVKVMKVCRTKEVKCQKSIFWCACPRLHPMNALYEWQKKWRRHFAEALPHSMCRHPKTLI